MPNLIRFFGCAILVLAALCVGPAAAKDAASGVKKIVIIAGNPSHGFGEHAHDGGCKLLSVRLSCDRCEPARRHPRDVVPPGA